MYHSSTCYGSFIFKDFNTVVAFELRWWANKKYILYEADFSPSLKRTKIQINEDILQVKAWQRSVYK